MVLHLIGTANSIMYTIASLSLPLWNNIIRSGLETLHIIMYYIPLHHLQNQQVVPVGSPRCFLMILILKMGVRVESKFSRSALKLFLFTWLPQKQLGRNPSTHIWLCFPGPFCNDLGSLKKIHAWLGSRKHIAINFRSLDKVLMDTPWWTFPNTVKYSQTTA